MSQTPDWLIVGRFGKPHGIKGFLSVHSFTEPRDNILQYNDWHMVIKGVYTPLKLLETQNTAKSIIVLLDGYQERELAARLTNVEIAIDAKQLPELENDEYYWHQLIGMNVYDKLGKNLGTVQEIIPTGSNDVLVVNGEIRTLIPWLPGRFITSVDSAKKIIHVDWDVDF